MKTIWIVLTCVVACRAPDVSEVTLEAPIAVPEPCIAESTEAPIAVQASSRALANDITLERIYLGTLLPHTPHISGSVLMVSYDVDPGLVWIDKGSNDGVMRPFIFGIYNGGQLKGFVRVETVQADECTAVVLKTYEGRAIEPGDSASTRI